MLIICEGADRVGKSTLVKALQELTGFDTHHFSSPPDAESAKNEYFGFIEDNVGKDFILDRSWLGELVYGPIWRDYEVDYFKELQRKLQRQRVLYILLHSDSPVATTGESPEVLAQHTDISNAFLDAFQQVTVGNKVVFNQANFDSLDHKLAVITGFVRNWRAKNDVYPTFIDTYAYTMFNPNFRFVGGQMNVPRDCRCPYFPSHQQYKFYQTTGKLTWGTGNLKPKYLFIGEAPGWKGCGWTGIPFYRDRSGMPFRDAMFWAGISEVDCYITNMLKCTPPNNKLAYGTEVSCLNHLEQELEVILPSEPKIFAVGRKPEQALQTRFGIDPKYLLHSAGALRQGRAKEYLRLFYEEVHYA